MTAAALAACSAGTPDASESAQATEQPPARGAVPPYLAPVFAALDTLLTPVQRDSLRALSLEEAFEFRNHVLSDQVQDMAPVWQRMPVGDTLIARGETLPGVQVNILMDLYQQYLKGSSIDLAAALHRMSLDYVYTRKTVVRVDSVILHRDLDGSGQEDVLVQEVRRGEDPDDGRAPVFRAALYLDGASPVTTTPAWAAEWSTDEVAFFRESFVTDGGTLLVFVTDFADAVVHRLVHVSRGRAAEVLTHQLDYGEGDFAIRGDSGRVVVTATKDVRIGGRTLAAASSCGAREWPGARLVFQPASGTFIRESSVCVRRDDR